MSGRLEGALERRPRRAGGAARLRGHRLRCRGAREGPGASGGRPPARVCPSRSRRSAAHPVAPRRRPRRPPASRRPSRRLRPRRSSTLEHGLEDRSGLASPCRGRPRRPRRRRRARGGATKTSRSRLVLETSPIFKPASPQRRRGREGRPRRARSSSDSSQPIGDRDRDARDSAPPRRPSRARCPR